MNVPRYVDIIYPAVSTVSTVTRVGAVVCEVGDEDGGLVHGEHGAAHAGHVISEGANKGSVVLSPHQTCTVTRVGCSAANRLIGEVVQSRRRPLLGPSPG